MILPDINLLVYAHNVRSSHHQKALNWWNQCLRGHEGVALAWATVLGFVRVVTHPRIFERPMSVQDALDRLEEWAVLATHPFDSSPPASGHFATWSSLLKGNRNGGSSHNRRSPRGAGHRARIDLANDRCRFRPFSGVEVEQSIGVICPVGIAVFSPELPVHFSRPYHFSLITDHICRCRPSSCRLVILLSQCHYLPSSLPAFHVSAFSAWPFYRT